MRMTVGVRVSWGDRFGPEVRERWGAAEPEAPAPRPPVVLLCDPDPDAREIGRVALESAGYQVVTAGDGERCVRLAPLVSPDLVVTELFSPRLDGLGVARALRRDRRTAGIPLLALTTCSLPRCREEARREGFARYLVKPVEPARLVREVERLTKPRRPAGR